MNNFKLILEVRQLIEYGDAQLTEYEDDSKLSSSVRDMHRALMTLEEELKAMDDYEQRIEVVKDEKLIEVLKYLLKEEKHHAALLMEWIENTDSGVVLPKD